MAPIPNAPAWRHSGCRAVAMALFRKPRRQRPAADVPEAEAAQPAKPVSGDAIRERLAEIAAASTVPEDALDQALRVVL